MQKLLSGGFASRKVGCDIKPREKITVFRQVRKNVAPRNFTVTLTHSVFIIAILGQTL